MSTQTILYSIVILTGVFISTISQIILKKRATTKTDSIIKEYLNFPVIMAYSLFFLSTLLSVIAYKVIPLSLGTILDSTSYIFITIAGVIFFNEKITKRKAFALAIIISGIIIFSV